MNTELTSKEQQLRNLTVTFQQVVDGFEKYSKAFRSSLFKEKFLTDAELSQFLKLDRRTLKRYRQNGRIPYYKLYGKIIYKESEINKLLLDNYYPAYYNK